MKKPKINDYSRVVALLEKEARPLTIGYMAYKLVMSQREVRKMISEARNAGIQIASNSDNTSAGYSLEAKGSPAMARTIADLKARIKSMSATVKALEDGPLEGQTEIDLG